MSSSLTATTTAALALAAALAAAVVLRRTPRSRQQSLPTHAFHLGESADAAWSALRLTFDSAFDVSAPSLPPAHLHPTPFLTVPAAGRGPESLPALFQTIVDRSARLSKPLFTGHMDTAPHPAAAMTDALVSALNNNLLFRELSPFASDVERLLCDHFAARLGLPGATQGIFTSGGSLANLTSLFGAVGGHSPSAPARSGCTIFASATSHASVSKAAAVLGVRVHAVPHVASGAMDLDELRAALRASDAVRKVVVGVVGGTVNGFVDDVAAMADVCEAHDAAQPAAADAIWLHIDGIWGGAIGMYASKARWQALFKGIDRAASVVLGPQKWLFVPRLCAVALFPGLPSRAAYDETLGRGVTYSQRQAGDEAAEQRGKWGLQGSRRADCLPLWVVLQVMGTDGMTQFIDRSLDAAQEMYAVVLRRGAAANDRQEMNAKSSGGGCVWRVVPLHAPMTNLLCLRVGPTPDITGERTLAAQKFLEKKGECWVSVSSWGEEFCLRCVIVNPTLEAGDMAALLDKLDEACRHVQQEFGCSR